MQVSPTFAKELRPPARAAVHMPTLFVGIGVAILFGVSGLALETLGLRYYDPAGSVIERIHPATYWMVATTFALSLLHRNPIDVISKLTTPNPVPLIFLIVTMLTLAYGLSREAVLTAYLDTFLTPVLVFLAIRHLDVRRLKPIELLIHALLFANAIIAIAEFVSGIRLFPIIVDGQELTWEPRSTALTGLPLDGSSVTAAYLMALILRLHNGTLPSWMWLLAPVNLGALNAFGGRTAFVSVILVAALFGLVNLLRSHRSFRFSALRALLVLIGTGGIAGLIGLAAAIGGFDQLLDRFADDTGSAKTRAVLWDMIAAVDPQMWLFGATPGELQSLQDSFGTQYGIENFWLAFMLGHGVPVSLIFFASLIGFILAIRAATQPATSWVILIILICYSASLSLGSKNIVFAQHVAMLMVLFPLTPKPVERRPRERSSFWRVKGDAGRESVR